MKNIIIIVFCCLIYNNLQAQTDSLAHYSLAQLDSICKTKSKAQDILPYSIARVERGAKELDTKDTSYAKLLSKLGSTYYNLSDFSNSILYTQQAIDIQKIKYL